MQAGPSINRRFRSALLCAIRLLSAQAAGGPAGDYGPESYTYDPTTGNLSSKAGVSYTYGDALHKHAVTGLSNGSTFAYDANGSMITRNIGGQTFNLSYDAENRMTGVTGAATANFVYDDTGARVIDAEGVTTTVYVGSYFEWHGTITDTVKYYYAGTVRVAMRKGDGQALFLLGDHLGSTNRLVHTDGTPVTPGRMRLYKAWGESRYEPDGELATEYRYTGQFEDSVGLYYFGARWYDSYLSRWTSPDTLVPDYYNPQDWDRYQYVRSNPVKYKDPSGHMQVCPDGDAGGGCGEGLDSIIPLLRARHEDELEKKRNANTVYANSLTFFAIGYDALAFFANACYAGVTTIATGISPAAGGALVLAYPVYSLLPNGISVINTFNWAGIGYITGANDIKLYQTSSETAIDVSISQDTILAAGFTIGGFAMTDPFRATLLDGVVVVYDEASATGFLGLVDPINPRISYSTQIGFSFSLYR